MINEYRTLEEVEKYMEDADVLNYRRCRDLFTVPPPEQLKHITIPCNRPIQKDELISFIKEHNIKTTFEYIVDTWKPVELNFIDANEEQIDEDDIELAEIEGDVEDEQEEPEDGTFQFENEED